VKKQIQNGQKPRLPKRPQTSITAKAKIPNEKLIPKMKKQN